MFQDTIPLCYCQGGPDAPAEAISACIPRFSVWLYRLFFQECTTVSDPAFIRYTRSQQLKRLTGQESIWK
jgi:hypothetical protein